MIFSPTSVVDAYVIDLERRTDERGYFARAWCAEEFARIGIDTRIAQINVAHSNVVGTMRGLHFQVAPHGESKLARCTGGAVYDVIVDLRPTSSSYCRWFGVELSADSGRMLFVPEGCAHGYLTLTANAAFMYQASVPYAPECAKGLRYDDPAFNIDWPAPIVQVSAADQNWPDYAVCHQQRLGDGVGS
ncbi:MAG: dTDP-4-dehydrorhamnose 3,5-epimerase family protein [Steroidobacteraceae bacterium]